jgi:hypothetical protein
VVRRRVCAYLAGPKRLLTTELVTPTAFDLFVDFAERVEWRWLRYRPREGVRQLV